MSFAIRVENLGKSYQLGATHAGSVRELVNTAWNRLRGRSESPSANGPAPADAGDRVQGNTFWALKDVSFEVKPGEVVGIIGRNGSGKSTLLKILSQITAPTTGRIELRGRVASLLEVGTGFHPELSGRENIYLNGAILGMTKSEITRKFDEIVAFAEIEKFIDTPVKRYSSGMYVRLAFAVAAHLEPEILVVDEVLAVGDAEFQRKCMGKMGDVSKQGRTIFFVSHNMQAVNNLCGRVVLLEGGRKDAEGAASRMTKRYLMTKHQASEYIPPATSTRSSVVLISGVMTNSREQLCSRFAVDEPIVVRMTYRVTQSHPKMRVGFRVYSEDGNTVFTTTSTDDSIGLDNSRELATGVYCSKCNLPPHTLNYGAYTISLASDIPNREISFNYDNALAFTVEAGLEKATGLADGRSGCVLQLLGWETTVK